MQPKAALVAIAAGLALTACGGQSAAESRFLASAHPDAPGLSDATLLQAGHDFCDHHGDPDGGFKSIDYVGDRGVALNIGLSADLYLCDG